MITIQPQYLTLTRLLDGRLFRIPEYQRAYSWTRHQRNDLFEDIAKTHAKGPDAGHFMAAIVCLRREKIVIGTDEFFSLEVVDGQQRLTTLIILINAIRLKLDKKNKAEAKLATELADLLVKPDGDELLLLQTNHDSSHHFANFIRKGQAPPPESATTLADRELLQAIQECWAFVETWLADGETLSALMALLKNRLHFLLHEVDDEKAVYTVFEVLNSRGLDVSWLDRLKSILMGAAFELENVNQAGIIKELHGTWRDIYNVVGLRQGLSTEALRFAATLRTNAAPRRPLGEEGAVETLRAEATNATTIRDVASWLLSVTRATDSVFANRRTDAVTRIAQVRLLAVAINLRDDLKKHERDALLRRWEKVAFRVYGMLGKDARTAVGDYVRLAWDVVNKQLSGEQIASRIQEIGAAYPIEEAIDALRDENCYEDWEVELRYLMWRYEEHLASAQHQKFSNEQWNKIWMVSPSDSIEHIWPQSKVPQRHRHRLGNLVLLPPKLNSKLSNRPAKDKVDDYRKTGLLIAGQVADIIEEHGWNGKLLEERENAILEWATLEWAD